MQESALPLPSKPPSRKRKSEGSEDAPKPKRVRVKATPSMSNATSSSSTLPKALPKISVTLKLGPRPTEPEAFPCCLCVSMSEEGLLRVNDPPSSRKDVTEAAGNPKIWMAHELCASIVPETWVDNVYGPNGKEERVVFGVDAIVKDRWNLVCVSFSCSASNPLFHYPLTSISVFLFFSSLEMFGMYEKQAQSPWCSCAVHERQMPQGVPCQLCEGRPFSRNRILAPARGRERGYACQQRLFTDDCYASAHALHADKSRQHGCGLVSATAYIRAPCSQSHQETRGRGSLYATQSGKSYVNLKPS